MNSQDALAGKKKHGRLFWVITALGMVAIAVMLYVVDLETVHREVSKLHGVIVFLIMSAAPLVGFPVSVVYIVSGVKFGSTWGMILVSLAIVIHLLVSWWIAHSWLRQLLNRLFERFQVRVPQIPEGESVPLCLLVALVPGISYTLKNYMLVLAGARFQPYFWSCLPAHIFHASLAVFFGDFTSDLTTPKIVFLVTYGVVLVGLSHYVVYRLRRRRKLQTESITADAGNSP